MESEFKKKKLLIFIPEFPRLTETFIEREVDKLVEFNNLDISVISLKRATGKTSEAVEKVTHYERLSIFTFIFSLIKYFSKDLDQVKEIFRLVVCSDDKESKLSRFIYFIKGIGYTTIFEKYNPDHIHSHFLSWPSTIGLVVSKLLGVPFSISAHAKDVFVDACLVRQKVQNVKFITVCNKNTWKRCIELAGEDLQDKILLLFHGMDPKKIFSGEPKMQKPDRPMILVVARLVEKKGLRYLIEASSILKKRGINHQIDVIGPGPLYEELKTFVSDFDVNEYVTIHGEGKGLPFSEVAEYYKIADIFALPSISTKEGDVDGVPTVVIEASFRKIPIVTTTAGSITDLITSETGVLVPQEDPHSLATAIEKLIFDPELRKNLGEKACQKAQELFDINKNVGQLEKLLLD